MFSIFLSVRTQAAEVCIICPSSSISFDNLDESLPCLICEEDTPDCESLQQQSSLFSEINSLVCFIRLKYRRKSICLGNNIQ